MVVLADQGQGCWVRLLDGRVLTPGDYAAASPAARRRVQFVAIPFVALVGDDEDPMGVYADEDELRRVWGESVSLVPSDAERCLCMLDGRLVKAEALELLPAAERARIKTKTVPAAVLRSQDGKQIDEARVAKVSQGIIDALTQARTEILMRVCAQAAAVPDEATEEECYDAWINRLAESRQDELTDELALCADDTERSAAMRRQLNALLPGRHAIVIGLQARADLNHCCAVVLEPSSEGRFPTRIQHGEREELVRVRPCNLWPGD